MEEFVRYLVIGLSAGTSYALIALGYTMVYGVLRLINFAHGDVYMVGAVTGFYVIQAMLGLDLPVWLALAGAFLAAIVLCAGLGFLIEFFAYRPLRNRPRLVVLITAIGVSLLLENLARLPKVFGPTPRNVPSRVQDVLSVRVIDSRLVPLTRLDVLSISVSVVLMVVLTWVVLRTRIGLALRAVSFRVDTARLMGINTDRVISFTFMFGSALAAVAGVLDGVRYRVDYLMGVVFGLKAFVAAVLGGIGSIPGAMVGGLLIGVTEAMARGFLPSAYSTYADAVAFVVLILLLLVRPAGLFGRVVPEKV